MTGFRRMSRRIGACVLAALLSGCNTETREPGDGQRAAEVEEIVSALLDEHPRGRELGMLPEFRLRSASLRDRANDLRFPAYVEGLREIFAFARDGHTAVLAFQITTGAFAQRLPLRAELFHDGVYVIAASDEALPLLGKRVTKFAGIPTDELLRRYLRNANGDNMAFKARWSGLLFSRPGLLAGIREPSAVSAGHQVIQVEAVDSRGSVVMVDLVPRPDAREDLTSLERVLSDVEAAARLQPAFGRTHFPLFVDMLQGRRVLYVSLAEMNDQPGMPFEVFAREVKDAMSEPGLQRMVIDLRQNGGGNNMLSEPLRREIVRSRFNRPGGLYVLTGRRTFSAAMNFATRLERETDALFVGEPTGGRPNHYGDAEYREGSVTRVPYLISTVRWQDSAPFDDRVWILPDVPVPVTFEDHVSGRDAALEAALRHVVRSEEHSERRIMAPWERDSQGTGWRFFFEELR